MPKLWKDGKAKNYYFFECRSKIIIFFNVDIEQIILKKLMMMNMLQAILKDMQMIENINILMEIKVEMHFL